MGQILHGSATTTHAIRAAMLGISGSQGFSFTSRGQTLIPATSR